MFSLQDANIHNIAIEGVFDDCQDIVKAVSNDLDFKRKYRSAPSIRSTGRGWWRRSCITSPATSRRPRMPTSEQGQLRRAFGQLRQHLRRPRRPHDGPADRARWCWPPTRTTCSTSSSAPACTACAPAADTHETSSPSMDISKASNFERFVFDLLGRDGAQGRGSCSASELAQQGQLRPERRSGVRAGRAALRFRQRQEHARGPRSPPSATRGSASTSMIDTAHRRRPEGRARASAAGRADDRAGDRAADQVRRAPSSRRWAASRSVRRGSRASSSCPSASPCCRPMLQPVKAFIARIALRA